MRDRLALYLAIAALLATVLQGQWQGWARRREATGLREQIQFLTAELAHLQSASLPSADEPTADPARLADALGRLGDRDVLKRYQAGLTVREFGDDAVPGLLALAKGEDRRSRESALLLLAQLDASAALPDLRQMAREALAIDGAKTNLRDTETASLLAILARHGDEESIPIFQTGLAAESETVRAAALAGARRLSAPALLPALAARLGKERQAVARQLEQTICLICRTRPEPFRRQLAELPPRTRYEVARALGADSSAAVRETLRELSRDPDRRVALGAARLLAIKHDPQARPALERILDTHAEKDVRDLAEDLIQRLAPETEGHLRPAPPSQLQPETERDK